MDLLVIAFYLSILTYYLGVLVYMLPIPFYGVKRWAPQLMVDGVFSAILVFSYTIILWVIRYLGGLLGADWSAYYQWFFQEINIVTGTILVLKLIGAGLSSSGLGFLANSLISPLISSLIYLLTFIVTFTIFVSMLVSLSSTLLMLGIILHAVPFRLARASGATLIALVIIFNIATPLLPQFVELVAGNIERTRLISYGYSLVDIKVYDKLDNPVPYYLYEAYSPNGTLLARYVADENGVVRASLIDKGLPSTSYIAVINIASYRFSSLTEISEDTRNLTYKLDNFILIRPLRYVSIFDYSELRVISVNASSIELYIESQTTSQILITLLDGESSKLYLDGLFINPDETYEYEWGGIAFVSQVYRINPGSHDILITYSLEEETPIPEFDEVYYARDVLGISSDEPLSLVYPVSVLVFRLFVAPVMYVAILFSASMALSRLLGGSSPKIARLLVVTS
ncbi:MAG: hypothetical protein ABWW65_07465 [Thermoprotei archaeon]